MRERATRLVQPGERYLSVSRQSERGSIVDRLVRLGLLLLLGVITFGWIGLLMQLFLKAL